MRLQILFIIIIIILIIVIVTVAIAISIINTKIIISSFLMLLTFIIPVFMIHDRPLFKACNRNTKNVSMMQFFYL